MGLFRAQSGTEKWCLVGHHPPMKYKAPMMSPARKAGLPGLPESQKSKQAQVANDQDNRVKDPVSDVHS